MLENSIQHFYTEIQCAELEEIFYCPMCEDHHANHTWCQAPGWGK